MWLVCFLQSTQTFTCMWAGTLGVVAEVSIQMIYPCRTIPAPSLLPLDSPG